MIQATLMYGDTPILVGTWEDVLGTGGQLLAQDPEVQEAMASRVRQLAAGAYTDGQAMPIMLAGMVALAAELRRVTQQWRLEIRGLPEAPEAPTTGRICY